MPRCILHDAFAAGATSAGHATGGGEQPASGEQRAASAEQRAASALDIHLEHVDAIVTQPLESGFQTKDLDLDRRPALAGQQGM